MLYGAEAAVAAPGGTAEQEKNTAQSAADVPSARVAARLYGHRVEALSERSETATTWVNKDGSLTTDVAAGPIRFKDPATDQWRDVDIDLVAAADGSVTSKSHPQGLRLSGKADTKAASLKASQSAPATDLVTLGTGDEAITLQWRGGLPAPTLDGTRATYADAVPGADVVVEATRTGFEQFVEVKAKPEAGFAYTLPLKTKGLKAEEQADGSVLFTDKKSKKTATMPAPVMWDASTDPVSGEHTRRAKAAMKVVKTKDGVDLVITPDAGFLADAATKYPVTVDPSTSALGNLFDTYVQQGETVDWSNDTELDFGNPGTKNADGTFRTARSFITWNTAPVADALISSAQLSLWNFHSGNTDCSAQPWEVWTANGPTTASRWTNQPAMVTKYATSTETKGNPACTSAPDGWVNSDVTNLVQQWANNKWTFSSMGLRATDENNTKQWKRVNSANAASNVPKLTVTYNYRPRTGTDQQAGPPFFKDSTGTWFVNTVTPTLRDTFVDSNGDKVNGTFQIFDSATDTQVGNVLVSPWVPSGQPASVTVPPGVLTNGKTYKFRTNPYDGTHYNLAWSAWKTFTVDSSAPSAPASVTSTDYPSSAWVKGAGQPGQFTVTPPGGDQNGVEWSLDGTTWTKVPTGGTTSPVNLTITPAKAGTNTLQVRATDKAENKSEPVSYTFHAGPGGVTLPDDGTRTAARVPLSGEADSAKYNSATFSWRRSDADAWTAIPAGDVTAGGQALTAWPVSLTAGKSPSLTWSSTSTVNPDGTVQVRADFTGPGGAASSDPIRVVVDRNADGAASQDIGPGSVNLLTGDYTLTGTDAPFFGMSVTRTASSRAPQAGAGLEGQAPIFGKEWLSGTVADATDSDYLQILKTSATSLDVVVNDGSAVKFTANTAGTGWIPEPGAEDLTLKGSFGSGDFTLSDTEGTVTTFTKVDPAATTWTVSSSLADGLAQSTTKVVSEAVTVNGKKLARPKRVIAASSATTLSTCEATPSTKGCRVLEFVYATSTTATAFVLGDVAGQVSSIKLWATAPGAAAATATFVAGYAYDDGGRLRETWDPRISPALKTAYAYDSAGRITTLTPPGQLPWTFTYGQAGSNPSAGPGMLLNTSRATLVPGTAGQTNGTATTSIVYGVPLTGTTAPNDLGAAATASWGQTDTPTDGTAVFPSDQVPAANDGSSLGAADYKRAGIHYLDASGREVNTATPGNHLSVTEYDEHGNTLRSLTAGNRELALGTTADQKTQLTDLGINALSSGERAQLLSETTVYEAGTTRESDTYGPLRPVTLEANLTSGATTVATAGSRILARAHTVKSYDSGRPTDGTAKIKDQVTQQSIGAQPRSWPDLLADPRVTTSVYDWAKGLPTSSTQDPGGLAITTTTTYDDAGRPIKVTQPASNGNDAGATVTTYYTGDGTGPCGGKPEWADSVCQSGPAADITGGGSNPTQLPTITTEYGLFGQSAKIIETANGVTRTTTMGSDGAGRPTTVTVTGGLGTAAPAVTTTYDSATGEAVQQTSTTGGTISEAFDMLGRQMSYTDADGATTSTAYDALDRPTTVTDSVPSTTTYTYNTAIDPRGVATSVTDSIAGTFSAHYDADGALESQGLPGGYTMKEAQDPTGAATSRTYTRDSDGVVLVSDSIATTVHGQRATHGGTPGVTASQAYTYDKTGRLTQVQDTSTDAVCTTRSYTFDKNTNRKSLATATAAANADCTTTGGTTAANTYDSADRLVNSGYVYDAFGRTTAMPGSTLAYYATDLVQQQTAGTRRQTWALDSNQRFRSWTTESNNAGTWTQTASKLNHYDSDADSPRWIVEDTATGALTRNVDGLDGNLGATTTKTGGTVLQLANLHGDITLQLPVDTAIAPTVLDSDEYGNPRAGQATTRYGWVGGKQRSSETLTGLTLMGVRLYDPTAGRFLSVDPIRGGNANAYDYVQADPANRYDLDGRICWSCGFKAVGRVAWKYKWDIALTAASFIPVAAPAVWAYRAYRVVKVARLAHSINFAKGTVRATRATAWLAGKMWTGRGAVRGVAKNGATMWSKGKYAYRSAAKKGKHGWSSNLTWGQQGHHNYFNFHVNHVRVWRWGRY